MHVYGSCAYFFRTNISTQTVWQLWPTCLHNSQVSILMWPREWSGKVCAITFVLSVRLVMSLSLVGKCSCLQMKHWQWSSKTVMLISLFCGLEAFVWPTFHHENESIAIDKKTPIQWRFSRVWLIKLSDSNSIMQKENVSENVHPTCTLFSTETFS